VSVVPVEGAPGFFDVVANLDFKREGDFDITISLQRGIDVSKIVAGDVYVAPNEGLANVHGTVFVAGRYDPVTGEDAPSKAPAKPALLPVPDVESNPDEPRTTAAGSFTGDRLLGMDRNDGAGRHSVMSMFQDTDDDLLAQVNATA
jgi:hypothetical protein